MAGALSGMILAAAVAVVWWPARSITGAGTGGSGPPGGGPMGYGPPPVEVVAAVETIAAEPVELLGSVAPHRESLVASEVEGLVAEVLVDEGDTVSAGQLLARLRTTTLELDLEAARANREEVAARLVSFEAELARLTDLLQRRAISQREYDRAVADRDAQVQSVARYEAEAARLQELIDRARLAAPFAGHVAAVHVEVGEWVGRGGDVVTLVDLSQVEVTVPIPERYASAAEEARKAGMTVEVRFDALPGKTYSGKLKAVIPAAIPAARTFPVLIAVDNPDGSIKGGMVARVMAQVGAPRPTVLVPKDALVLRRDRAFVFRTRAAQAMAGGAGPAGPAGESVGEAPGAAKGDGADLYMVEEVAVEIGPAIGGWQIVIGPIAEGDLVVVRGNERLQPGMPVNVVRQLELEPPPTARPDQPIGVGRFGGSQ